MRNEPVDVDVVLHDLGPYGRYQMLQYVYSLLIMLPVSYPALIYVFIGTSRCRYLLSVCLSVRLSVCLSSVRLSVRPSVCTSVCLYVCMCIFNLCVPLSFLYFSFKSICMSTFFSFVCLSFSLSVRLSVFFSVYFRFVCTSL